MSKPTKLPSHRPAGESVASKRRLALKTVGGGALVSGLLDRLPHTWQSPLVDSAVLPAHAQVSFTLGQFTFRYITTSGARSDLLTPYRITPLGRANSRYLLSVDRGGSTQFVQADPQGLDRLIPAALAQSGGFPIGLSVAEHFNLEFGSEHTVNTPAFGYLALSDGQAMCRFPVSAWLDGNGAPQFAGGRDIHSAVGEPCGESGNIGMFYAGQGFLNDQARLGAVPPDSIPAVPQVQFALTGFPDSTGQDYRGNEGGSVEIQLVAFNLTRPQNVWVRGIIGEGSAVASDGDGTSADINGDYIVSGAQRVGDHYRFRIRIDATGTISTGAARLNLLTDQLPDEGIETLVLEIEPAMAYRVGDRYRSRVSIYERDVPLPTTVAPAGETVPPTQPPPPAPTPAPEISQIGLVVMDTDGNELVTMMFDYAVQRDSARRIDYMRFPATAVQTAMHQPASRVLEILFPTALAQADELHLAQEVVLDFTDGVLTKTAELDLRYDDTNCTGTFSVEVMLYSGRLGIQSITGNSSISACGSVNVTIEAGSGFGTFPPPPGPSPTTTAAPTIAEPTTTVEPAYIWTWTSGDYTVNGRFTLTDNAQTSGVIDETHLASHTLTAIQTSNGVETELYQLDLVNNMLTRDGTTTAETRITHDFQYTLGATSFLEMRTDTPALSYLTVAFGILDTDDHVLYGLIYANPARVSRWRLYDSRIDAVAAIAQTAAGSGFAGGPIIMPIGIPVDSGDNREVAVTTPTPGSTVPPTTMPSSLPYPAPDATAYTWIWTSHSYTVEGAFTLKSTAPASGTIGDDQVETHVLRASQSGTELFWIDLVNSMLTVSGSPTVSATIVHDFQYTLGASSFLGTRTDTPVHNNLPVNLLADGIYGIRWAAGAREWFVFSGSMAHVSSSFTFSDLAITPFMPPTTMGIPSGERWFEYTWTATSGSNTYTVNGEFRTRSQATAGIVREADVFYHKLTAMQGSTQLFEIDLIANTLNGSAVNLTMHDFEFTLPADGAAGPFAFHANDQRVGGYYTTELAVSDGSRNTTNQRVGGNITGLVYWNFNNVWQLYNGAAHDSELIESGTAPVITER